MANNFQGFQYPTNPQTQQLSPYSQVPNYQPTAFFPQPVGSVYSLNTANDIANVPVGTNLSVGLCLNESIVHIKSLQNGTPVTLSYKLTALDSAGAPPNEMDVRSDFSQIESSVAALGERISILEEQIKKNNKGGSNKWVV